MTSVPRASQSAPPAAARAEVVLGVDLRIGPRYPTGVAVLDSARRIRLLATVRDDDQIEALVERWQPAAVAIDAPLALPEGRDCADPACECARFGIQRAVDRLCRAAGYRPYPTLLPSMVRLTLRGIALHASIAARGTEVYETYPGMAQDILGIPRKGRDLAGLERGLRRAGVRGLPRSRRITHDELDAATCALVARLHLEGATEEFPSGGPARFVFPRRVVVEA